MTAEESTATKRSRPPISLAALECRDAAVTDLVSRARNGDKQAWDTLVGRYAPLIWSICRKYELRGADAEDVGQSVWLHLVDHLDQVRDPAALPGWLATTARRECIRVVRGTARCRAGAERREHLGRTGRDGGGGTASGRATRGAARGTYGLAAILPAADRPADRGPACAVCRDQRQAGHPGRQHRAKPPPLPGQTASRPGHRRADQRRSRDRHLSYGKTRVNRRRGAAAHPERTVSNLLLSVTRHRRRVLRKDRRKAASATSARCRPRRRPPASCRRG